VTATEPVSFNPFEPGFFDDPYEQYRRLREAEPVHHSPLGTWMLTRHADVTRVLRDPTLSVELDNAEPLPGAELREELAGDRSGGSRAMLNLDPPDHDRLRRLASKAFTPKMVQELRPRVQQLVDETLDRAASAGTMDIVADLAFPLPFTVISEMLGMPVDRRDEVRAWSHALTKTLDPIVTEDDLRASIAAGDAMTEYVRELVVAKRRDPDDRLLSGLIGAEDRGDVLDEQELIDQVILLYVAGHETTVNLIGNGALALLRNPDQLRRWHDDPELDQNAVEELLRFDSPVQFSRRVTLEDVDIDGHRVEARSFLFTCLGSANRDPEHWGDDADVLDLGRATAGQHASFGGGIHHCLGSALARTEGQVALGSLARHFPQMALAGDPVRNDRIVLRGLDSLPVSLGA